VFAGLIPSQAESSYDGAVCGGKLILENRSERQMPGHIINKSNAKSWKIMENPSERQILENHGELCLC
jgi:hypothetical protein